MNAAVVWNIFYQKIVILKISISETKNNRGNNRRKFVLTDKYEFLSIFFYPF